MAVASADNKSWAVLAGGSCQTASGQSRSRVNRRNIWTGKKDRSCSRTDTTLPRSQSYKYAQGHDPYPKGGNPCQLWRAQNSIPPQGYLQDSCTRCGKCVNGHRNSTHWAGLHIDQKTIYIPVPCEVDLKHRIVLYRVEHTHCSSKHQIVCIATVGHRCVSWLTAKDFPYIDSSKPLVLHHLRLGKHNIITEIAHAKGTPRDFTKQSML